MKTKLEYVEEELAGIGIEITSCDSRSNVINIRNKEGLIGITNKRHWTGYNID